ncbi:hypothetical protein JK164_08085 [Gluconobacter kondonii]|uniref:hypothetical protein n=1 Tax=Gluconobacter kondonii TaxID=941463 RepID=UPI001B8C5D2A|nr:hypothetical protein [Gluconobacter kondonii]MBS1065917.1 hypothetical protein [Gluconobacter kondonii]
MVRQPWELPVKTPVFLEGEEIGNYYIENGRLFASAHGGESTEVSGRSDVGSIVVRELYDKKIAAQQAAKKRREEADKK